MSFLPEGPTELTGGCFCSAIRYKVSIPASKDRPLAPGALPTPVSHCQQVGDTASSKQQPVTKATSFPLIDLDHCHSCRRACGSIVQCWLIIPSDWVAIELLQQQGTGTRHYPTLDVIKPNKELQDTTFIRLYSSTPGAERTFCGRCGTPVTYFWSGERPSSWTFAPFDIALGTLDRESFEKPGVRPDRQGWWNDGTAWVQDLLRKGDGGLVRHPTGSPATCLDDDKTLLGI